ncbi:MAG: cytochrome c [Gemmatimonadota bacterium]
MKTVLKWIGRGVLAVSLLLVVSAGIVYALSERVLNRTYDVQAATIIIPSDSASIVEGERLARIRGCYDGCHGQQAEGGVFFDDAMLGTITAPDLTRAARTLSDAELTRVIRHGVRTDGSSVAAMPSSMLYHLTDEDLGSIIAFLRSLPRTDGPEADLRLGPLGRFLFVKGDFQPAAEEIDHDEPRLDPGDGSDPIALGRYLAMTSCTECHGLDLGGGFDSPNLAITAAYTPEQFRTLMRSGEPFDGRELRLMDDVSRKRFSYFTEAEVDALYAFLTTELVGG